MTRKLHILLAVTLLAIGLQVPPAEGVLDVGPGVAVCLVGGFVAVDPGVPVPSARTGPGHYDFIQVYLVCAGDLSGVCFVTSTGTTDGDSPTSGFAGTFNSVAPCIPTSQPCGGNIGGQRIADWTPPPVVTVYLPPGFPGPKWSFSAGPFLAASLDDVDCAGINPGPPAPSLSSLNDGSGIFAAVAGPDPLTLNGGCRNPTNAPVNFCGININGAAVIVWP